MNYFNLKLHNVRGHILLYFIYLNIPLNHFNFFASVVLKYIGPSLICLIKRIDLIKCFFLHLQDPKAIQWVSSLIAFINP